MFSYLVTIKRNKIDFTSAKSIYHTYNGIVKKGGSWSSNKMLELDSRHRLHMHTVVMFNRVPYFKRFQKKGWTIHFKRIDNDTIDHIWKYIYKNNKNEYDVVESEIRSYYHYNCGFTQSPE